ncbi:Vacuolar protease A [Exophiala bonariae]|uniref:Vacuolar protease A n=1 Tax=Exophiala bonariae TaxID=1690606 RepID=A0AAV9NT04_9EURO|nr:Vacuolar protease A [Exophiala bonariae]
MVDLHSLPKASRPQNAVRNNGPDDLTFERYKLRELAEGWPSYRDACEWENLKSIFHPDAYIYTTWTGRTHHLDFIAASQKGMDNGAFIMHRCHGISTDINPEATRAVTKMKATITQRFDLDGAEADAESDCRFCFFWIKENGEWRARYVRHWYEKDKLIPVNPAKVPQLDEQLLKTFPTGYRYLAYCQEKTMGVKVLLDMPGHRREKGVAGGSKACGEKHDLLYWQCKDWVEGRPVEI